MKDDKKNDKDKSDSNKEEFEFEPLHAEEEESEGKSKESTQPEAAVPAPEETPSQAVPTDSQTEKGWFARNKTLGLFLGFLVIAAGMWFIQKMKTPDVEDDPEQPAPVIDEVPVNVIEARLGRFQDRIDAVGTLKGEAEIELRFEVEGKIEMFDASEGDRVRRGTIIARISDRDSKLKVDRAKNEVEKMEKLFNLGGVSKTKLEEARLNLEVAQAEFDKTRLRATRDGILGDKAAEVGEFVTPQRKIATLVAIKNVVVDVGIIEKQVDKVYPGQKILVTVDAYPGNVFEGTIKNISPMIAGEAKTFSLTARIPNEESLLLPGMFARARIITYEADDAISVPNDALVKSPGGFQVYVVNKDNIAEARDVEVGYVATEFTQIESGLDPSEVVVVQKPPELESGNKVKIIEVQNQ